MKQTLKSANLRATYDERKVGTDKRYKILEAHIKRLQYKQDTLIEVLHQAQALFGYLDEDTLKFIAHQLKLPLSRVYGVVTFYHFFKLKPQGEHTCVVCMGTACYVKGAGEILANIEKNIGIKPGQTTPDGKISLLTARCIGACGIAPAVVYDNEIVGKQTSENVLTKLKEWIGNVD